MHGQNFEGNRLSLLWHLEKGLLGLGFTSLQSLLPNWVAVLELELSHHSSETMLFTMYPYHGSLN